VANKAKAKIKTGRPTKYNSKYCEEIISFFNRKPFDVVKGVDEEGKEIVLTDKSGNAVMQPCMLPTFEGFAISIGVHRETLLNWMNEHKEFFDAYARAKDHQKEILIQNGLFGNYEKTFAVFTAKNVTDMSDKQEIDHQSSDGSMSPKPTKIELVAPKE
jgi:hypothetical protein